MDILQQVVFQFLQLEYISSILVSSILVSLSQSWCSDAANIPAVSPLLLMTWRQTGV